MNPVFGLSQNGSNPINAGPFGNNQSVVIPQITIPTPPVGFQQYRQLTAKGKEVAKNMQVPPSTKAAIFDEDEDVFYFKETDQYGNVIAFDTYRYAKVEEPAPPQYVTVDSFNSLVEEFKKLREDINNGQQSVRRQDKQHSNKQWDRNRSAERPDSANKIPDVNYAGQQ